jgi:hypothetical protein
MLDELVLRLVDKGYGIKLSICLRPHHDNVQVGEKCPMVFEMKIKQMKGNVKYMNRLCGYICNSMKN